MKIGELEIRTYFEWYSEEEKNMAHWMLKDLVDRWKEWSEEEPSFPSLPSLLHLYRGFGYVERWRQYLMKSSYNWLYKGLSVYTWIVEEKNWRTGISRWWADICLAYDPSYDLIGVVYIGKETRIYLESGEVKKTFKSLPPTIWGVYDPSYCISLRLQSGKDGVGYFYSPPWENAVKKGLVSKKFSKPTVIP